MCYHRTLNYVINYTRQTLKLHHGASLKCSNILYTISQHLDYHGDLSDEWHGFCQKRNCETQFNNFNYNHENGFAECLNQKGQCYVLLLDFCMAVDKVAHTHLFQKLSYYGIRDTLIMAQFFLVLK